MTTFGHCPHKKSCSHSAAVMACCPASRPCDTCYDRCHYYLEKEAAAPKPLQPKCNGLAAESAPVARVNLFAVFTNMLKALRQ